MINDSEQEFYEKIKTLSTEELYVYERTAALFGRFIDAIAISSIFVALVLSTPIIIIVAAIGIYVLGYIGVGMNRTLTIIREQIAKSVKSDK